MIMNCSLSNVTIVFYKGLPPVSISNGLLFLVLEQDLQNLYRCFWILLSLHKLLNTELRINYVPEIQKEYNLWEQALCRYCIDPLVFDRWGYTWATWCSRSNNFSKRILTNTAKNCNTETNFTETSDWFLEIWYLNTRNLST